ncbi:MAG: SARP family transcriptional regulator [Dehalococcoidia bacterium]|nr:SARP family transcriptional regulator [Dehalococcoidia bacterium]
MQIPSRAKSRRRVVPGSAAPDKRIRLSVLGNFDLRRADASTLLPALTPEAQHLLALLAIRNRLVSRASIAGTLWPEASDRHAHASLRSALSRLTQLAQDAVVITDTDLALSPSVAVDLHEAQRLARALLEPSSAAPPLDGSRADAVGIPSLDCLPDWYDDWLLVEAEEWRQLRLHALSALADRLCAAGQFGDAIAAALAGVRADPLRESAWATVIRIHLAEGNQSEALRSFEQYRTLLDQELGIEPTPALRGLLLSIRRPVTPE